MIDPVGSDCRIRGGAVVFILELVSCRDIALVARAFYGERYVALPSDRRWSMMNTRLRAVRLAARVKAGSLKVRAIGESLAPPNEPLANSGIWSLFVIPQRVLKLRRWSLGLRRWT
jgi:hypothetical protein